MEAALSYAEAHGHRFVNELMDLLRMPSISTDPVYAADVAKTAEWLTDHLRQLGANSVDLTPTQGHPIVTAEFRCG